MGGRTMNDAQVVGAFESVNGTFPLTFIRPGQFGLVDPGVPVAREGILHDYRTGGSVAIVVLFIRDGSRLADAGSVVYDKAAPGRAARIRLDIAQAAAR